MSQRVIPVTLTNNHPFTTNFNEELNTLIDNGYRVSFAPLESKMFGFLFYNLGELISVNDFMDHLYSDNLDPPYHKIIDVKIFQIRKALKTTNFTIKNRWGAGYSLEYKQSALHAIVNNHLFRPIAMLGIAQ